MPSTNHLKAASAFITGGGPPPSPIEEDDEPPAPVAQSTDAAHRCLREREREREIEIEIERERVCERQRKTEIGKMWVSARVTLSVCASFREGARIEVRGCVRQRGSV